MDCVCYSEWNIEEMNINGYENETRFRTRQSLDKTMLRATLAQTARAMEAVGVNSITQQMESFSSQYKYVLWTEAWSPNMGSCLSDTCWTRSHARYAPLTWWTRISCDQFVIKTTCQTRVMQHIRILYMMDTDFAWQSHSQYKISVSHSWSQRNTCV